MPRLVDINLPRDGRAYTNHNHNNAFTRPHSPVCVTFKPRLSLLKKLVMDAPQKLPLEPIIGPLKPLLGASRAGKLERAALQSARCDPSWDNADQALAEAYGASASLWEAEIWRITGAHTTTRKGLRRGTFPELSASRSWGALDDEEFFVIEDSGVALTPGANLPGVGPPGVGVIAQALAHKISVQNTAARTHMLWTYTR